MSIEVAAETIGTKLIISNPIRIANVNNFIIKPPFYL